MSAGVRVRPAGQDDFLAVHEFVSRCPPLEGYPKHVYKILLRHFGGTCFVAEREGRIAGFVMGFASQERPRVFFLWQVGVDAAARGSGVGRVLLDAVEAAARARGCDRMEVTIDPVNRPSQRLFEKAGYANASRDEGSAVEVDGSAAVTDYYGPGRHFMLYEKRL